RPIVDRTGRVFAVLAGRPQDPSWDSVNGDLQKIFDIARDAYALDPRLVKHRRGEYSAIGCGISYGGGQQYVSNLTHSPHNRLVVDSLLGQRAVQRVANFSDSAMQLFAPRLYNYYESTLHQLLEHDPGLKPNFPKNVFGAATFNLGPRTVTYTHRDHLNLPFGWCSVTAIGEFDPVSGGHLVLWDLKMLIEFPPGSTVLIPSALLLHSNCGIAADERRSSFTQYSAGGLFRWVECGFQPMNRLSREEQRRVRSNGARFWDRGVGMLSLWSELA
ncbi:hypothetical protein FKP32DRAFT_1585099, partial [Trametes sanguinea]